MFLVEVEQPSWENNRAQIKLHDLGGHCLSSPEKDHYRERHGGWRKKGR